MGDPRKFRSVVKGPRHPWQKERIESERKVLKEYGLKNKREIWQMDSLLKKFRDQAKSLIAAQGVQAELEKQQLMSRLARLGLISVSARLDDILDLSLQSIMERRLQSVLVRKGLAKSMNQARQFITHTHVIVGERVISRPSYLVAVAEEGAIKFHMQSTLANPDHPVRVVEKSVPVKEIVKEEAKEEKKLPNAEKRPRKQKVVESKSKGSADEKSASPVAEGVV